MVKQRAKATIGPPGVRGDSACGEMSRGTWETHCGGGSVANTWWENITAMWLHWESEGFIVAKKRLITVERRDPAEEVFR
jgi:hypothetical protein